MAKYGQAPNAKGETTLMQVMHERYTFIEKNCKQVKPPELSAAQLIDLETAVRVQSANHKSDPFFSRRFYSHCLNGMEDYREYMTKARTV